MVSSKTDSKSDMTIDYLLYISNINNIYIQNWNYLLNIRKLCSIVNNMWYMIYGRVDHLINNLQTIFFVCFSLLYFCFNSNKLSNNSTILYIFYQFCHFWLIIRQLQLVWLILFLNFELAFKSSISYYLNLCFLYLLYLLSC